VLRIRLAVNFDGIQKQSLFQKTGIRFCGFQFVNWDDGIRKAV
jgi:hypothetical protein